MISLEKAQRLVMRHAAPLGAETVPIDRALGRVLAEDVRSPVPLPPFDNSAMDGYTLRAQDTSRATAKKPARLRIVDTIFAGDVKARALCAGEAYRIMTGAPVPKGADTVVPQEDAVTDGKTLIVGRPVPRLSHVRRRGEEVKKGARVLRSGAVIRPGTISCLATAGKAQVRVARRPAVSVVTTGDELVKPGGPIRGGQIYDSNSYMTAAMLRDMGIEPVSVRRVKDRPAALRRAVRAALERSDAVIILGGVSVGEHDYVRPILAETGVKTVFWRVKQKPGKPIVFGTKGRRLVFGLPGNPASGFTCFYMYVYPALRRLAGYRRPGLRKLSVTLVGDATPDKKRWRLLKAKLERGDTPSARGLARQGSHMVTTLAETDGLIVIPSAPDGDTVGEGSEVTAYELPYLPEDES